MKKFLCFCVLLFSFTAADSQLISDSLLIEGRYRSFHYNKPAETFNKGSLIFILHGSGGNGKGFMRNTIKLEAMAAKENFLAVYPDGYKNYWNECRKASTAIANTENINENAFFEAMIIYFYTKYGIDDKKVFAAGFSGGGHMAYKLALTEPGKIKGIAAIVANMPTAEWLDCGEAKQPMPVLIVNGTADETNPYKGGEMFVNNASFGIVRSTEQSFAYWSALAGYKKKKAKKKLLPDTDTTANTTIEKYTFKKKGKPEVTLLKVINGKHENPADIDVYVFAWNFFKRQMKN